PPRSNTSGTPGTTTSTCPPSGRAPASCPPTATSPTPAAAAATSPSTRWRARPRSIPPSSALLAAGTGSPPTSRPRCGCTTTDPDAETPWVTEAPPAGRTHHAAAPLVRLSARRQALGDEDRGDDVLVPPPLANASTRWTSGCGGGARPVFADLAVVVGDPSDQGRDDLVEAATQGSEGVLHTRRHLRV